MALIEIKNLCKTFGSGDNAVHALEDVSLNIEAGEIFGIIGLSGAGKSTLLLLVAAYAGEAWHTIYDYALAHDFRFLSYGDSSVLMR